MLNKTVFTILSLFFCLNLIGQDYYIQGFIAEDNSNFVLRTPLKNATITIVETSQSAPTDSTGYFEFAVNKPGAYNLKIESVGYISQTVNVTSVNERETELDNLIPFAILLERTFEKSINNSLTPDIISTISRANLIQTAAPTLPDAISQVSGVWMSRPTYMNNAISIRGMTGNRNVVYLDGIPLNHSMLSSSRPEGLNLINMAEIQAIEISKGGQTVNAGDGALGGVVDISTISPDYSDGEFQAKVFASTRLSNSNEFLLNGGSEISMENFAIRYGLSIHSIGIAQQEPTSYTQLGGHMKGIAYLNRGSLEFGYNGTANIDYSDIYPNVDELYLDNLLQDQDRQMAYVKYNKVLRKGPFRIIKAKLAYQRFNEKIQEPLNPSSTYRLENTNNNFWLNLTGTSNLGEGWKMLSGIELKQEFVNSFAIIADTTGNVTITDEGSYLRGAKYSKVSLYNIHTLNKGNWNYELGIRGNWINLEGVMFSTGFIQNRPLSVAGNIKTVYNIDNSHQIIGSINSNFRTPTFENFLSPKYFENLVDPLKPLYQAIYNNDLVAEKSVNFELAYRVKTSRFNSQLALFRNQLLDLFDFRSIADPSFATFQQGNTGRGSTQGVELDVDAVLTSNFKLAGNLTYTSGHDYWNNLPMRYIPPVHGMINLAYQYKNKLTANLVYQFAGIQTSYKGENLIKNLPSEVPELNWSILNLNVGYQLNKINISAGIRNVFDKHYRLYGSNINEYRRNLWFGVRYNM